MKNALCFNSTMSATTRNYGADQNTLERINRNGIIMEQRAVTSVSQKPGANGKTTLGDEVIQEQGWTLDDMLGRMKFVKTIPYSGSSGPHSILAKFRIPQDLILNNALTKAPFENFVFWNGDVVVHAQMTASPTAQGCVMMVFIPLTTDTAIESQLIPNFAALSVNQCAYLFPNTNTAAEMTIKYNSPYPNLRTNDMVDSALQSSLGYLYFVVLNPLMLSASSSDNVSISLFTHFENNKFKIPRVTGASPVARPQSKSVGRPKPASNSLIDKIVDTVLPESVEGDVIKMGLNIFGMALDNPVLPVLQEPVKVVSTQYMNFPHGAEYIDKMALYPSLVATTLKDTFATTTDEMEIDYVKSIFSYLGTVEVKSVDAVGKVLASVPLNPCPVNIRNNQSVKVPLLQYISSMYNYWTGNLVYKIQVVSTMMQTCKVLVAVNYDTFTPIQNVLDSSASQYGKIIEINQGSNLFELEVEYAAPTLQLMVPNRATQTVQNCMGFLNFVLLNPLVATNGAPSSIYFNVFIAGAKNFALNTLTDSNQVLPFLYPPAPALAAKQVVYRYQETDTEEEDIEVVMVENPRRIRARPQAAAQPTITPMSNVERIEEEGEVLAPVSKASLMPKTSQQPIVSLRDVVKKYNYAWSVSGKNYAAVAQAPGMVVVRILISELLTYRNASALIPPTLTAKTFAKGCLTHISSLYRLMHGGLNLKIMGELVPYQVMYQPPCGQEIAQNIPNLVNTYENHIATPVGAVYTQNNRNANQLQLPGGFRVPIHYVNGVCKTAEFCVPFTSMFSSLVLNHFDELVDSDPLQDFGHLYLAFNNYTLGATELNPKFDIFVSISDETRFGTLFRVPLLFGNSYQNGNGLSILSAEPDTRAASNGNTLIVL